MPTYIALMNWTDQGIRSVKDTVQRREQAEGLAQKHGARIEEVYWEISSRVVDRLLRSRGYLLLSSLNQLSVSELGSGSNQRHQVRSG